MIENQQDTAHPPPNARIIEARERRMRRLAWLMDASIPLPGGLRIGLDGLLGLVPGVGDLSAAAIASYIIYEARELGAPRSVIWRMAMNVILETVIGAIPIFGDLFDFYYKANLRNLRLLEDFQSRPKPTVRDSRLKVGGFAVVILVVCAVALAIPVLLLIALIRAVG